ncbi:unnamed protein product, partial [Prorocentrum cordatum]
GRGSSLQPEGTQQRPPPPRVHRASREAMGGNGSKESEDNRPADRRLLGRGHRCRRGGVSCTRWGAEARVGVLAGRRAVAGKGHQLHQAAAHCVPDGWHLQGCHADGRDARTGRDGVAQQGFLLRRLGAQPDERVRGAQLRGRFLLRGPMVGEHGERQGALSA